MRKLKLYGENRYRDEYRRTYYCPHDKRKPAATLKLIRYSDGRTYTHMEIHNSRGYRALEHELGIIQQRLLKSPRFSD
jgi:hypothetical protein